MGRQIENTGPIQLSLDEYAETHRCINLNFSAPYGYMAREPMGPRNVVIDVQDLHDIPNNKGLATLPITEYSKDGFVTARISPYDFSLLSEIIRTVPRADNNTPLIEIHSIENPVTTEEAALRECHQKFIRSIDAAVAELFVNKYPYKESFWLPDADGLVNEHQVLEDNVPFYLQPFFEKRVWDFFESRELSLDEVDLRLKILNIVLTSDSNQPFQSLSTDQDLEQLVELTIKKEGLDHERNRRKIANIRKKYMGAIESENQMVEFLKLQYENRLLEYLECIEQTISFYREQIIPRLESGAVTVFSDKYGKRIPAANTNTTFSTIFSFDTQKKSFNIPGLNDVFKRVKKGGTDFLYSLDEIGFQSIIHADVVLWKTNGEVDVYLKSGPDLDFGDLMRIFVTQIGFARLIQDPEAFWNLRENDFLNITGSVPPYNRTLLHRAARVNIRLYDPLSGEVWDSPFKIPQDSNSNIKDSVLIEEMLATMKYLLEAKLVAFESVKKAMHDRKPPNPISKITKHRKLLAEA